MLVPLQSTHDVQTCVQLSTRFSPRLVLRRTDDGCFQLPVPGVSGGDERLEHPHRIPFLLLARPRARRPVQHHLRPLVLVVHVPLRRGDDGAGAGVGHFVPPDAGVDGGEILQARYDHVEAGDSVFGELVRVDGVDEGGGGVVGVEKHFNDGGELVVGYGGEFEGHGEGGWVVGGDGAEVRGKGGMMGVLWRLLGFVFAGVRSGALLDIGLSGVA